MTVSQRFSQQVDQTHFLPLFRHSPDLSLLQLHLVGLVKRHWTVGEQMLHQALLELSSGRDYFLGRVLGLLDSAEEVGDGFLFGDRGNNNGYRLYSSQSEFWLRCLCCGNQNLTLADARG